MRSIITIFLLLSCLLGLPQSKTLLDNEWKFHHGDADHAQSVAFTDDSWRNVDLPHDFSIEDLPGSSSPFANDAINGVSTGFTKGGTAWYRKIISIKPTQYHKKLFILFDGIYCNARVWLNGQLLGIHPYGYTPFIYEITDKISETHPNILAVQVNNNGATTRWYPGSGINRHVWLLENNSVHLAQWGVNVSSTAISKKAATIINAVKVLNDNKYPTAVSLHLRILNANGIQIKKHEATQLIPARSSFVFKTEQLVRSPVLWCLEHPTLYTLITEVWRDGRILDRNETKFGIRKITFDTLFGFRLNDMPVKLKGGCFHNDNGPLGARSYDAAEIRKVALLKANGFNALRCAHNPPPVSFLDACDSMGMLVIDEAFDCWTEGKRDNDYHVYFKEWWRKDLETMVLRDFNHPSVIMWSIGNEILGMNRTTVVDTAQLLANAVRFLDTSRPVLAAANDVDRKKDPFFQTLDIAGYNYAKDQYDSDHIRVPSRIIVSTESFPLEAFEYWSAALKHPYILGDFVWTGFDYLGEASIGWRGFPQDSNFFPWNQAYCGDIDICGWKRPQSYYRDVLWKPNQISLFVTPPNPSFPLNAVKESWSIWNWEDVIPSWTWNGLNNHQFYVTVYSSCQEVELFLNGHSFGKQLTNNDSKFKAQFKVPYQPGTLKAVGYSNGQQVNETILRTADTSSKTKCTPNKVALKANNQDLSYVTVELLDKNNILNPSSDKLVSFSIEGEGKIVGVGNANPMSIESCQNLQRMTWRGKCLVIIKSSYKPGKIILKATIDRMPSATTIIYSK